MWSCLHTIPSYLSYKKKMSKRNYSKEYIKELCKETDCMISKMKAVNNKWVDLNNIYPDYLKEIIGKGSKLHENFYLYVKKVSETCWDSSVALNNILEEQKRAKKIGEIIILEINESAGKLSNIWERFEMEGDDFIHCIDQCQKDLQEEKDLQKSKGFLRSKNTRNVSTCCLGWKSLILRIKFLRTYSIQWRCYK